MERTHRIGTLALVLVMIVSLLPAVTSPAAVLAQSPVTVEEAVADHVASVTGADAAGMMIEIVAEQGDWYYGTATDADINVSLFLAHRTGEGFEIALRYDEGFQALLTESPPDFPTADIRASLEGISLAGDTSSDLSLPWPIGEHRRFSATHQSPFFVFYPVMYNQSEFGTNLPILAMRSGTIYFPCTGVAMIDHGDGYATYYNNLEGSSFSSGQRVERGQQIGGTSAAPTCRSTRDGSQVEVWLTRYGQRVEANGLEIGGYSITTSEGGVNGPWACFNGPGFGDCTMYSYRDGIPNLGLHGASPWPNASLTLQDEGSAVARYFLVSGFPPNTLVTMSWQRPDGSRLPMGTVKTNAGGSAYGIWDYPDTWPGTYTRNNMFIAQAGSLIRMVEMGSGGGSNKQLNGLAYDGNNSVTVVGETLVATGKVPQLANSTFTASLKDSMNAVYPLPGTITTNAAGEYSYSFVVPMMASGTVSLQTSSTSGATLFSHGFVLKTGPLLNLSEKSGQGGPVLATLKGFAPNTNLTIRGYTPYSTRPAGTDSALASVTTNAQGNASVTITIWPGYNYNTISVEQGSTTITSFRYAYVERSWLSVGSAAPGTTVTFNGLSHGKSITRTLSWHDGFNWITLATGPSDAAGQITIPFTVPTAAAPGSTLYIRITGGSYYFETVSLTVAGTPAQALVANAGPDQSKSTATGTASVTLNGSGSTPSALITSYSWARGGVEIANTANPTVSLPVGVHDIELTVRDSANRVALDNVVITVTSTNSPSAQFSVTSAIIGSTATFTLAAFPPATEVKLFPPSISSSSTALATVTTDAAGAAQGQFTVPTLPGGTPLEFIFSASSAMATATLSIDPLFSITGTTPLIWTKTGTISASGFLPGVDATLEYQSGSAWIAIPLNTPKTGSDGRSSSSFTVPNTIPVGMTTFRLTTGAISKTTTREVIASIPPTPYIAWFSSSYTATGPDGYLLSVDGSGSTDSDGTIVSWVWTENGVELGTGATASFWLQVGAHTITLTVTDNSGASASTSRTTTINNLLPTANAGPDQSITINPPATSAQVTLDGSGSSDVNGTIVSYSWTSNSVEIATGVSPTVTLAPGNHYITLRVTDNHGGTRTDSVYISIYGNRAPTAVASVGSSTTFYATSAQGATVNLNGSSSSDYEDPKSALTYSWAENGVQIATTASAAIVFPLGSHTVTLTVTDTQGVSGTASVTFTVIAQPTADAGPDQSHTTTSNWKSVTLTGSLSTTPPGSIYWYWYEGSTYLGSGKTLNVDLGVGTRTIRLEVTLPDGSEVMDTLTVTITRVVTTVSAGPDQNLTTSGTSRSVTLSGSVTNPPAGGVYYAWYEGWTYLGEGQNLTVTLPVGTHIITLEVETDDDYLTDTVVITIVKTAPATPAVTITPVRTTVNSRVTYTVTGFPANADLAITWRRLSGSSVAIATVRTDAAGAVSGTFKVPATTGGPGQQIIFKSGSVSRTLFFELAPRVKSNTSPGLRGQTIDFSLRGFAKKENIRVRWWNPNTEKWVDVGTGQTSNTGSANIPIVVPTWAGDGLHKVRAETASFNQQTNVVLVAGGAPVTLAVVEATPTPEPTETPTPEPTTEATPEVTPEPEITPDPAATPEPTIEPEVTPEPTEPAGPEATPTPATPEAIEPEPTPSPEPPPVPDDPD